MKYKHLFIVAISSLVLFSGSAWAAEKKPRKPRTAGDRAPEVVVELTENGKKLEAKYTAMLDALRAEITAGLPRIDDSKKAACLEALKAEEAPAKDAAAKATAVSKLRAREGELQNLQEQLKYAPKMVADAEAQLQRAQAMPDDDAGKAEAVQSAQKRLDLRREEADALPGSIVKAQEAIKQAEVELPAAIKDYEAAAKVLEQARANTRKLLDALDLGSILAGGKLDSKLAQYIILSEQTPRCLAQFAQQGPEKEKLIERLFSDTPLMTQMLVADGAFWEKYAQAMELYTAVQKASPRAKEGVLQRLALAVSLMHAVPMALNAPDDDSTNAPDDSAKAPQYIDPLKRYLNYEKWYLDGELDPTFKDQSVWNLKMVVDQDDSDEACAWGRQMLRNYRPDLIALDGDAGRYVNVVDAEVMYGSGDVKYDRPELERMQNILANGGICGRRAFFGRFMLRSFGIPTVRRKEPGHATLACWAPGGWQTYLGGHWGGRSMYSSKGAGIGRYGRDMNFLENTQAREDQAGFLHVKRAQWIGDVLGEKAVYGRYAQGDPGFWYGVSLIEQQRIIDGLSAKATPNARRPVVAAPELEISEADRKITVDGSGVITIPAAACSRPTHSTKNLFKGQLREAITFMKSDLGGMQLHYSRYGQESDTFKYTFDAPKAGRYQLAARVVTPDWDQFLHVSANGAKDVDMVLPYTVGMWQTTQPVVIELAKGKNTLTFSGPSKVSVRDFKLAPVK